MSRSQLPCWIHTQRNPGSLYVVLANCRIHRKKLLPAHFCSLKSKMLSVFFSQGRQPRELEILAGCERDATLSSSCREKNARCERVTPTVVLEGNLPAWCDGESKARRWKSAAGRCETGAEVTGCCRRGRELSGVSPGGKGCKGLVWRGICFWKCFGDQNAHSPVIAVTSKRTRRLPAARVPRQPREDHAGGEINPIKWKKRH